MLLVIDNYDSFTYNLVQYLGELKVELQVHRNDQITVDQVRALKPDRLLISPGPCSPNESGLSNEIINQSMALGRFGWKANQPSLRQQNASAFLNDMGVTTSVFKQENCPEKQIACRKRPLGMVPEQPERAFNQLLFYTRALAVPARRRVDDPLALQGEQLFAQARCAVCHAPEMKTGEYPALPQLAHQIIHPYTDLLLHDMGEGLADGRPDFLAGPRDWRTPPLWGIGLSRKVNGNAALLHDGRARDLTEAILWHGGEADVSREAFRNMPKPEREALLAFLNSL